MLLKTKTQKDVVRPERFELPTFWFVAVRLTLPNLARGVANRTESASWGKFQQPAFFFSSSLLLFFSSSLLLFFSSSLLLFFSSSLLLFFSSSLLAFYRRIAIVFRDLRDIFVAVVTT